MKGGLETAVRFALLFGIGCVSGVLALSLYVGVPFQRFLKEMVGISSVGPSPIIAQACSVDVQPAQEDIFFLSCGGIY